MKGSVLQRCGGDASRPVKVVACIRKQLTLSSLVLVHHPWLRPRMTPLQSRGHDAGYRQGDVTSEVKTSRGCRTFERMRRYDGFDGDSRIKR